MKPRASVLAGLWTPRSWPFTVRVPAVVALFMIGVSVVMTNGVLARLSQTQERQLQQLAAAYLDGLSTSLLPHVVREDVWEVFDTLDRATGLYKGLVIDWTFVANDRDQVLASSAPDRFPSQSPMPAEFASKFTGASEIVLDVGMHRAFVQRALVDQGQVIGRIHAQLDIDSLLEERRSVLLTLLATNTAVTLLLAALGYVVVRRMIRPVHRLSRHLQESARGQVNPIPYGDLGRPDSEMGRLLRQYNALVDAVNEREVLAAKLAEEERVASLGRLAAGIAHEINNPLGGMLNALDALKRHGESASVRATSLRLIEQGLTGIQALVKSTLSTYRADRGIRDLTAVDLDDLRLLLKPEAKLRSLTLNWCVTIDAPIPVPVLAVRDAALNLLLNACHSSRQEGTVSFRAFIAQSALIMDICDSGPGLPEHIQEYLERKSAGSAPLDRQSGLGLWIVKRLCEEMGASLRVLSSGPDGSAIRMTVPYSSKELRNAA